MFTGLVEEIGTIAEVRRGASVRVAVRAEKVLDGAGIDCKLIPVPRHVSSDCGVCVRVLRSDRTAARQALQRARVEIDAIHDI